MSDYIRQYEQLSPAVKLLVGVCIVGFVTSLAWDTFVTPKLENLLAKQEQKMKIDNELKELNKNFVSPLSMEEELSIAKREFRRLIELLPQDASVDRVLNDFASLSRTTGIEIREFTPSADITLSIGNNGNGQPQNNQLTNIQLQNQANQNTLNNPNNQNLKSIIELDETNAVGLKMKMLGSFAAIVSFLDLAMSLPRVIRIQDFEITNSEKDLKLVQKPKLTFQGLFYAYYQKPLSSQTTLANADRKDKKQENGNKIDPEAGMKAENPDETIDKLFSAKPLDGDKK